MTDIINCKHMKKYDTLIKENKSSGELKIIQILRSKGRLYIDDKTYPVTYGSLYFINSSDTYSVVPEKQSEYLQNSIVISKKFLNDLAKLLEFKKFFIDKEISFLQVKHYKIIDNHFKIIPGVLNSKKNFQKHFLQQN